MTTDTTTSNESSGSTCSVHHEEETSLFVQAPAKPLPEVVSQGHFEISSAVNEHQKGDYNNAMPSFLRGYIGSCLLAMPYNFHLVGICWGLILTLLCCLSNQYVMNLIVKTCDDCSIVHNAWGKMCKKVGGAKLQYLAEIALLISQVGMCIGEAIFVLKFLNYVFCQLSFEAVCDSYLPQVAMILLFIIPLTAVTNMYYLSIPNKIADYITMIFTVFVVLMGAGHIGSFEKGWIHLKETFFTFNFEFSLIFCGTLLYSVGGVGAILDVRASMKEKQQFHRVLRNGMVIVGVTYAFFGSFGFLAHTADTKEIYLFNLPLTKPSLIIQALFLFTIPMTYITNQFPIISIIESWIDPNKNYFLPNSSTLR